MYKICNKFTPNLPTLGNNMVIIYVILVELLSTVEASIFTGKFSMFFHMF